MRVTALAAFIFSALAVAGGEARADAPPPEPPGSARQEVALALYGAAGRRAMRG